MGVIPLLIIFFIFVVLIAVAIIAVYLWWRSKMREAKNLERGLKMVPLLIHLPPLSDDTNNDGRDARDANEEAISRAQVMYNIISGTAQKGFKNKVYGQRHISFEIVAKGNLIHYYAVVPTVLIDTIQQAIIAAYPTARIEEVKENNLFSKVGKINGTIGGEFVLKKSYDNPIATYEESRRDAMSGIVNALSTVSMDDGVGVQILIRPANQKWTKKIEQKVDDIRKGKSGGWFGSSSNWAASVGSILEALWKPPEANESDGSEFKQLSGNEQAKVESLEEKARYAGFETMIRVVASSNTAAQSQALLQKVVSVFSLFDSPTGNGFRFVQTTDIKKFVTDYILRIFPQARNTLILNTVELSTIFHLPDQFSTSTSKVERQTAKQVDGPSRIPEEGLLLGSNLFRGVKKTIRLTQDDRRRHMYVIGATGMGKSTFLENLAYQDIVEGRGFAFVDPHGDSAEKLLSLIPPERLDDVIYFNPGDMEYPMGMNIFEVDKEDDKDFIIQECINMLYSIYDPGHTGIFGPMGEHMFRNAALLLMADPDGGTWIDIPKVFRDPEYVKDKIRYVKDQRVIDYWTKEFPKSQQSQDAGATITWFVSKWGPFESNTIFRNTLGQVKGAFNIREVMDGGKILLVNLSKGRLGELNAKLLGMIFVMKFQAAAMARVDMPAEQRRDFCLFVDEFQNFATESFESILSEARKFRLNLVVANQFMTQLTDEIREAIIGNIGTVICGRIGVTDAELMVKRFQPTFDISDLQDIPNHEAVIEMLIDGLPTDPFTIALPPPMGNPSEEAFERARQRSIEKYAKPRAEVEREINDRYKSSSAGDNMGSSTVSASGAQPQQATSKAQGKSFIDQWLEKKKQQNTQSAATQNSPQQTTQPQLALQTPAQPAPQPTVAPQQTQVVNNTPNQAQAQNTASDEVVVDLRNQ